MSIKIYDCDQGSDEWHDLRRGMVTASTIGALITPKTKAVSTAQTGLTKLKEIAAERITARSEDPFTSRDIERGHFYEPIAREEYAKHKGVEVQEVGFIVRDVNGHKIGYSPDGLVTGDGLIEIKSRKQRIQVSHILDGVVPDENMAQLQTGLFVTGRGWIDYVSYSTGMPMMILRVLPDPAWQEAIGKALEYAEQKITEIIADYETRAAGMPATEYVEQVEDWELELGGLQL
ncbi:MAG: YqaJ viral recombinase family protein [Micrococcaceae bacterium]|nr:YqaJ viral recombinase family protein [Micrococcaceae bacterium]